MGEFAHLHANSDPCVQIIFPGGRKLNSEFNLFFHADIHNYITFSINWDKDSNDKVITHKLNQNYMNWDICSGCAR